MFPDHINFYEIGWLVFVAGFILYAFFLHDGRWKITLRVIVAGALVLMVFGLVGCSMPQEEKENIAAVTCSIMSETLNMDAAVRVRELNEAREKIGGEPFLRGDAAIKEAFEWGLCQELVLNENYDETLQPLKDAKRELERIAAEKRAEEQRIAEEERIEAERIAEEKRIEAARIAEEKRVEAIRIAEEKQRIADTKPAVKEEFHSNGKLKSRKTYQSKVEGGKRHGLSEWFYENGQLKTKGNIKDGKYDGLVETYFENGQLRKKSNWKDGQLNGLEETYYLNGQFESRCYKNNEQVDMSYCEN